MPIPLSPLELKEWIRAQGVSLGFDAVGFTSADPLEDEAALAAWLREGCHAGMAYMARTGLSRARPRDLLQGAQTVIATLTRYQALDSRPRPVASYAARPDYHRVLMPRLRELAERIVSEMPGTVYRLALDTAPLLEKALAARAGLGWIGKSTNLVNERLGCYTLLGEILIDRPLPPDPPAKHRCGTCTRCLDACPTGAFPGPYRLDARRCLSYWTIEHRGAFPVAMREALGRRLFGCDDCLAACPFGHRIRDHASPALPTDPALARDEPRSLFEQARDRFKRAFGHSPVVRALKRGFLRNAVTTLVHAEGARARSELESMLAHEDPGVRAHAAWALGAIGAAASRDALARALASEPDNQVVAEIASALESSEQQSGRE
ncbi:MAG: tRNA epoxyqueuosine(34) reductase QueG [Planctomycetota bacterium]